MQSEISYGWKRSSLAMSARDCVERSQLFWASMLCVSVLQAALNSPFHCPPTLPRFQSSLPTMPQLRTPPAGLPQLVAQAGRSCAYLLPGHDCFGADFVSLPHSLQVLAFLHIPTPDTSPWGLQAYLSTVRGWTMKWAWSPPFSSMLHRQNVLI